MKSRRHVPTARQHADLRRARARASVAKKEETLEKQCTKAAEEMLMGRFNQREITGN
jgi:hypothetical protein